MLSGVFLLTRNESQAGVVPMLFTPHCKSSNAMIMLYFQGSSWSSSLWFGRKIHTLPNDLYNYRIYGVLKQPLGKASKGRGYSFILMVVGLHKRKWSKWQLFVQIRNLGHALGQSAEQEETQDYTQMRGVVYSFSLWTLSKTFHSTRNQGTLVLKIWKSLPLSCLKYLYLEKMWMKCRCLKI